MQVRVWCVYIRCISPGVCYSSSCGPSLIDLGYTCVPLWKQDCEEHDDEHDVDEHSNDAAIGTGSKSISMKLRSNSMRGLENVPIEGILWIGLEVNNLV